MLSTRDWKDEADEIKAAGVCVAALQRFRPPRLLGREAFSQNQSVIGLPTINSSDFLMTETK